MCVWMGVGKKLNSKENITTYQFDGGRAGMSSVCTEDFKGWREPSKTMEKKGHFKKYAHT